MIWKQEKLPKCLLLTELNQSCENTLRWQCIVCQVLFKRWVPLPFPLWTFLERGLSAQLYRTNVEWKENQK
jgi:hypothetical protein